MRVLHIVGKDTVGGSATLLTSRLAAFADFAPEIAHHVIVLQPTNTGRKDSVLSSRLRDIGIEPVEIEYRGGLTSVAVLYRALEVCRTVRPDVLHGYLLLGELIAGVLGLYCRRPVFRDLISSDVRWPPKVDTWRQFTKNWVYAKLRASLATTAIAVGDTVASAYLATGLHTERDTLVIHPPFGLAPKRPRRTNRRPSSTATLVSVGRLVDSKDTITTINALAVLHNRGHNVRLLVAGDGPERERIATRVEELGLQDRVDLLGFVADIPSLLEQATIYISASRAEGVVGFATLEAIANGLPVIATAIPEVTEVLDDACVLLFSPGDSMALADCFESFISLGPDEREMMVSRAQSVLSQFAPDKHVLRLARAYRDANAG